MTMKLNNPFLTAGYAGPDYFCDRSEETRKLLAAIENDRNVTLIAPRRYGKTGLIHNLFTQLPRGFTGVYLDIFSIKDLAGFGSTQKVSYITVGTATEQIDKSGIALKVYIHSFKNSIRKSPESVHT